MGKALAFAAAALVLAGCSNSGSSTAVDTAGLFMQKLNAEVTTRDGQYDIRFSLPYSGGPLTSDDFLMASENIQTMTDCSKPQTFSPYHSSLTPALKLPPSSAEWVLFNGAIRTLSPDATMTLSCVGKDLRRDYVADDEKTVVLSYQVKNFVTQPLNGFMANSPADLLAGVPLEDWAKKNYFPANARWADGSAYITHESNEIGDFYEITDCPGPHANGKTPVGCDGAAVLEDVFPFNNNPKAKPSEFDEITDGTISTVQGLRMWVASAPLPFSDVYRFFVEINGAVYIGEKTPDGAPIRYLHQNGVYYSSSLELNSAAVLSVANHFIAGGPIATGVGTDLPLGNALDLFGIGGHGYNGSLAPEDLLKHYSVPAKYTGQGQTIVIVDAPGTGDYQADLNVFSAYYNLPTMPTCAPGMSSPCYKHIDLANGKTITGEDWAGEVALDLQAAHAMAPNANLVLVTATDATAPALIAAIHTAAAVPGATVVSMSFGYGLSDADQQAFDAFVQANPGIAFVSSTGDSGDIFRIAYPAASPYVLAIGGTRIKSVSWVDTSSEVAWLFSSGGLPTSETMPDWQKTFLTPSENAANSGHRAIPDVAADADFQNSPFGIFYKQTWETGGGTSLAAPLWGGMIALVGEAMQADKHTTLAQAMTAASPNGGGLNAMLYAAKAARGTAVFHDVTQGNDNVRAGDCALCETGAGYNNVTGLGTPDLGALIDQLFIQIK